MTTIKYQYVLLERKLATPRIKIHEHWLSINKVYKATRKIYEVFTSISCWRFITFELTNYFSGLRLSFTEVRNKSLKIVTLYALFWKSCCKISRKASEKKKSLSPGASFDLTNGFSKLSKWHQNQKNYHFVTFFERRDLTFSNLAPSLFTF